MPDREKVIRGLACCLKTIDNKPCPEKYPYLDKCLEGIESIFKPLMSDGFAMLKAPEPGWISVKDRMPEENQDVLIYGYWRGRSGTVYKELHIACIKEFIREENVPIAWMPLPEPPKEGT